MCSKGDWSTGRQLFVLASGCLTSFSSGIIVAFPSVLNPSILAPNSTIHTTSEQASWIASSHGFAGILGFFILSPLFQMVGRKYLNFAVNAVDVVGWIMFIFATSTFQLLSARLVQGIMAGSYFITAITISEYCDPKRRGYFMSMKKISQGFGSLTCHSLALFLDWRQIAAVAAGPQALAGIMTLFWPESPAFLAMKGRFDECEKSFIWVNGKSIHKQKELKDLINAQTERLQTERESSKNCCTTKLLREMMRKDFLKPFFIVSLLTLAIDACGRFFLLAYLTQIMIEITNDKSVAMYCSVASDCLIISALITACFLIRKFKRRTLLFSLGFSAAALMFLISLVLILKSRLDIGIDVRWLVPSMILMHSFISHVGIVPTAFAISAEIFPLEHKGLGSFASGVVFAIFYAVSLKVTPVMIEGTGVSGTYSIYGVCVSICLVLLWWILPETKDKTLQQIEDEIKGINRTLESDLLIAVANDKNKNGTSK